MRDNEHLPTPSQGGAPDNNILIGGRALIVRRLAETQGSTESPAGFGFPVSPETGDPMNLDERASYLRDRNDRMRINLFVDASLRLGAERMDGRRVAGDREPIHIETLREALGDLGAVSAFRSGNEDVVDVGRDFMRATPKRIARLVADHLDPGFNNPVMVHEVVNERYKNRPLPNMYPFIDRARETIMQTQGWSPELRALMTAVGMHQTAIKQARKIAIPFLAKDTSELPELREGFEAAYWQRKVSGNKDYEGAAFYVGYTEKSRALLRQNMRRIWGIGRIIVKYFCPPLL